MKKRRWLLYLAGFIMGFTIAACEALDNAGLSEADIVEGLKTALVVGTDSSVTTTSATDGYLKDQAIKILLPPEAKVITDNLQYVEQLSVLKAVGVDLSGMVDKTITSMNRAAESAAKQAAPIFKSSITNLNITDGLSILNGKNPASKKKSGAEFDSTAATQYLISTTRDTLTGLYAKPVDAELDKDLLGLGFSTNTAWTNLTSGYNLVADAAQKAISADALLPDFLKVYSPSQISMLQKFAPIQQTSLGTYVTGKALDGLFLKVGNEEREIRRDPLQWAKDAVGTILEKVFGKK